MKKECIVENENKKRIVFEGSDGGFNNFCIIVGGK